MSEQSTGSAGGFSVDLAEAFNPAPGTGCCGSPAANTGVGSPAAAGGPCCGTAAEAEAEDSCCGAQAKERAVASGTSCCG